MCISNKITTTSTKTTTIKTTSKKTTVVLTDFINSTESTDSIIVSDSTDPYDFGTTNGKLTFKNYKLFYFSLVINCECNLVMRDYLNNIIE